MVNLCSLGTHNSVISGRNINYYLGMSLLLTLYNHTTLSVIFISFTKKYVGKSHFSKKTITPNYENRIEVHIKIGGGSVAS